MSGAYADYRNLNQRHDFEQNLETQFPASSVTRSMQEKVTFGQNNVHTETLREIVIDAITQENDLAVLESQISPDEVITNSDITNTDELIDESRILDKEEEEKEEKFYRKRSGGLYTSFSIWDIIKKSAINLVLPFINGMMLGFGEILAHEIGFHYRWHGARVEPPRRLQQRKLEKEEKVAATGAAAIAGSRFL
ncbi:hypothetical protein KGF56_001966 [Candida oxycetoniae]|uniref:Uncharacterized protein n=1 Tax=Candida oxycetoniae TaxID=497107 RepID=A0AAI9SY32_9ASCO|nr:uncharacterized protein KGF56_001966 [Candida oxycetoniae]KAI3405222.2 hypothetical protein KGF56_001966 [Candida oxycetoniae]